MATSIVEKDIHFFKFSDPTIGKVNIRQCITKSCNESEYEKQDDLES